MPKGLQAAQIVHAAGESSPGNLPAGCYAVVLAAPSEALLAYEKRLSEAQVPFCAIVENSGEYAGQITAIGVRPERRSKLKRYFSSLPLLK